jgi:hypothetical protein
MIRRLVAGIVVAWASIVAGIKGWWGDLWGWSADPPSALVEFSHHFFDHALIPMYWLLALINLSIYVVLLIQQKPGERAPARWLRRFTLAKTFLWLALLAGRRTGDEWRGVLYMAMTVWVAITGLWFLIALTYTYVWRPYRHRPGPPPPLEGTVLPGAEPYTGPNRRGPFPGRRRTDWRTPA